MRPKYNLKPLYTAIFLTREDWIHGPVATMDVQGFVWFTDWSGTEWGTEALWIKRYIKEGSGKGISLDRDPPGGTWRKGSFTRAVKRKASFYFYWET